MDLSRSLAMTMAGVPTSPSRNTARTPTIRVQNADSEDEQGSDLSLYHGKSNRPLGWKKRGSMSNSTRGKMARAMQVRRFDGQNGTHTNWDALRRDPELWFPDSNCLIHLYEAGWSRRGPTFRVPLEALLANDCHPLLDRFQLHEVRDSEISGIGSILGGPKLFELFIPAPATAERGQAFLYHIATRNLLAWIFGKPLVGTHLGGALVGLLNSMTEFRSTPDDNVPAMIDYIIDEGYADMSNNPDHALGILFFAEHFHFKDLWIDAHAHCVGMSERLYASPGFEYLSTTATDMISSSRFELHIRLDSCGRMLSSFLSDELSDAHLGLTVSAREHLDKFRSFLQMYFVAQLGYYPPQTDDEISSTFPKHVYTQMHAEFQNLYDFLADRRFTAKNTALLGPRAAQGGICVYQNLKSFDHRHGFTSLGHALPLLPEELSNPDVRKKKFWGSSKSHGKMGLRLAIFAELSRATNYADQSLLDCTLVRAYRSFEKQCVMEAGLDKTEKLSQTDARKVRWILVYSILQVLRRATQVPEQVRGTQVVPYYLGQLVGDSLPWKEETNFHHLTRTQTFHTKKEYRQSVNLDQEEEEIPPVPEIKPDIDYLAITQQQPEKTAPSRTSTNASSDRRKSTVKKALGALGNMPDLIQPLPRRRSTHHEIVVRGYGNGSNSNSLVAFSAPHSAAAQREQSQEEQIVVAVPPPLHLARNFSFESVLSSYSRDAGDATGWSRDGKCDESVDSPTTSVSSVSRSGSGHSAKSQDCHGAVSEETDTVLFDSLSEKTENIQGDIKELENVAEELRKPEKKLKIEIQSNKTVSPPPPSPRGLMDISDYMTAMKEVEAAFKKGVADFASQHDIVVGQSTPTPVESAPPAETTAAHTASVETPPSAETAA